MNDLCLSMERGRGVKVIIYSWGLLTVQLLECLQIEVLGGNANDEYVRWHVSQEDFEKARTNKEVRSALAAVKTGKKMINPNPVYVEAIEGGPWGKHLLCMLNDGRRLAALFTQLFGTRNGVPCRCFEEFLVESDSTVYSGMHPFPLAARSYVQVEFLRFRDATSRSMSRLGTLKFIRELPKLPKRPQSTSCQKTPHRNLYCPPINSFA